ncbi:MAG: hypothetical protein M1817_001042 [Caeruleum heppii]|nr:MAG: hypothetical protein M1817_001042 [Caeruleum heppii]
MGEIREWSGDFDPFEDPEEKRVLFAAVDSFHQYAPLTHRQTHARRQAYYALPSSHRLLLSRPEISYLAILDRLDEAIDRNAEIADAILQAGLVAFGLPTAEQLIAYSSVSSTSTDQENKGERRKKKHPLDWRDHANPTDIQKAQTTIRQLWRDWSGEGRAERDACYDPVLADLEAEFPISPSSPTPSNPTHSHIPRHDVSLLIPGCGLARLCLETTLRGFRTEGNEISYHMLLASSYMLNHTTKAAQHVLHPWVGGSESNLLSREDQLQRVVVPDVCPTMALREAVERGVNVGEMSMTASDFMTLYEGSSSPSDASSHPDPLNPAIPPPPSHPPSPTQPSSQTFNAVITIFFIDTTPNFLTYLATIHRLLKSGGIWINLGPLLWHFDGGSGVGERSYSRRRRYHDEDENHGDDGDGGENDEEEEDRDKSNTKERRRWDPHPSIPLTDEEVMHLVRAYGFSVEKHEVLDDHPLNNRDGGDGGGGGKDRGMMGYLQNPASMLQSRYRCSHWVARKVG